MFFLAITSVPFDFSELVEIASKLITIPTNFSFFSKYGRDEKSFTPVSINYSLDLNSTY